MGCPDWPKCFGSWIPPQELSELPEDYQELYAQQRLEKNARLVGYLEKLGMNELAFKIANDPSIREEQPFNATKTWIEYVNRLIGVVIGFLVFATLLASIRFWKIDRPVFWASFLAFFLTGVQGWIGSIVVSTNLLHGMINLHLFLAIVIVAFLIYAAYRVQPKAYSIVDRRLRKKVNILIALGMLTMIIQTILGTDVRAMVDHVAKQFDFQQRELWISELPTLFKVHRTYSLLILALHVGLAWVLLKSKESNPAVNKQGRILVAVIVAEIISGALMAYFAIPAWVQPVHLLFATLIMGIQFYILLVVNQKEKVTAS